MPERNENAEGPAQPDGYVESSPPPLIYRSVPALPEGIRDIRHALTDWAALAGLSPRTVEDLAVATDAAMTWATQHAGGVEEPGTLTVGAVRTSGPEIRVTVTDHAPWHTLRPDRIYGLTIHRFASHAERCHTPDGTSIRMSWLARTTE
jgi:hypothetical protein